MRDLVEGCEVHRRREHVVGALPHVHVVVGVHALDLAARHIGDDLIGIHVGRRPRTGLEHVHRELVVKLAARHSHSGLCDRGGDAGLKQPQLAVGTGSTRLDAPQPVNHRGRHRLARDREVVDRLIGLSTPQLRHSISLFRINRRARLPTHGARSRVAPRTRSDAHPLADQRRSASASRIPSAAFTPSPRCDTRRCSSGE